MKFKQGNEVYKKYQGIKNYEDIISYVKLVFVEEIDNNDITIDEGSDQVLIFFDNFISRLRMYFPFFVFS